MKRLIAPLCLLIASLPAQADEFLVANRVMDLTVLDAYGLGGLKFRPACADPWDGEVVSAVCEFREGGNLSCPPVQEDPPRGGYLENRWNRFIGCYGGSKSLGFWTHGPANGCVTQSGTWSYWWTSDLLCCEPLAAAADTAHPNPECHPMSVPSWGHHSLSVFSEACESAIAVGAGIALQEQIPGFEAMVLAPPAPRHDGEQVECRILKRDLHALMLARQPPALSSHPPGLDGGGGTDPPIEPPPTPVGPQPLTGPGKCVTEADGGAWRLACLPGEAWECHPTRWAAAACLDPDCAMTGFPFPSEVQAGGAWSGLLPGKFRVTTNACESFSIKFSASFVAEVPMAGEPPIEPPVPPDCPELPTCPECPECPECPPVICPDPPACPPAEACKIPLPRQVHLDAFAEAAVRGALLALDLEPTPLPSPPPSAGTPECPGCFYGPGHYSYVSDKTQGLLSDHLVAPSPLPPPPTSSGLTSLPCDHRGAAAVALSLSGYVVQASEMEGCRSDLSKPPPGSGNWPVQAEAALCLSGLSQGCDKLLPLLRGAGGWGINGWESWSPLYHASNVGAVLALANDGPPEVGTLVGAWLRAHWAMASLMTGPVPATLEAVVGAEERARPWRDRDWGYSGPVVWAPGERACRNPDNGDLCPHMDNTALHMALGMALDLPRSVKVWTPSEPIDVTLATLLPFVLHQYAPGFGGSHNPALFGLSPIDRETLKAFVMAPTAAGAESVAKMAKGYDDPREMRILRGPGSVVSFWEGPTRNSNKPAACLSGFWGGQGHYIGPADWKGVGAAKCSCRWEKNASTVECSSGSRVLTFTIPEPDFWIKWKGKIEVKK